MSADRSRPPFPALWVLAAALLLGLFLRHTDAVLKSLWLDELHTLAIGWRSSVSGVLELLNADIHAPLYFLVVHAVGKVDPHLLRFLSIVPGLLALFPLLALAEEARFSTPAKWVTALAFAALPYQIQYGAELRPYAWLQLCCVTMAWAAFSTRAPQWVRLGAFALAAHVGLWVHYFAGFAVLACGAARLLVRWPAAEPRRPAPLWALVAAGAVAGAAFLPHLLVSRGWLFTEPEVLVTNPYTHRTNVPHYAEHMPLVLQSIPRMLATTLHALGGWQGIVACGAIPALLVLWLLGPLRALRDRVRGQRVAGSPLVRATLVAGLVGWLLIQATAVKILDRSDTLQYLTIVAWVWPLVLGAGVGALGTGRFRTWAAWAAGILLLLAGFAHATGLPREDMRRAVAMVRAEAGQRGALVSAALTQRPYFPTLTVFEVYAPGLAAVPAAEVPPVGTPEGDRPIVVLARRMGPEVQHANQFWRKIPAQRRVVQTLRVDSALTVYVLEPVR